MPAESEVEEPLEAPKSLSFAYESHLRDFIVKNLASVAMHGSRLTLYVDQNGRDGVEYPTAVGRIDILARDDTGGLVVFELKLSRGHDHTVGQILRYMGWVKQHLAGGAPVRGVIVAKELSEPLRYAVSMTPLVSLHRYEVSFNLSPVELGDAV